MANLTRGYGKKVVKRKWKKQNIIKHATWNVRGKAHREEELDSVLNDREIEQQQLLNQKIINKLKGKMETNNYVAMYSAVDRSTKQKRL